MTDGRIAPDTDDVAGERVFAVQLTATIFCENNFHGLSNGSSPTVWENALPDGRATAPIFKTAFSTSFRNETTQASSVVRP